MSVARTLPAPLSPASPNSPRGQEAITPEVDRLKEIVENRFSILKATLDGMQKAKKTLGDDKVIYSLVESMKWELATKYEMLKTWGGKRKKTRRRV
jgi:hypothetical protein